MMISIVSWFYTSRIGRFIAAAGAITIAVLGYGWSQRRAGKKELLLDVQFETAKEAAKKRDIRNKIDRTVRDSNNREFLRKYARDRDE